MTTGEIMSIINVESCVEYDDDVLEHLHNVQLMIFKDFIELCEKHNLTYFAAYGTVLGAIRHKGFIPWDDDIDLFMFREDYEKFLKIMQNEKQDKYTLLCWEHYDDYYFPFAKLSLNGTKIGAIWADNSNFDVGINIDIFPLDNLPDNKFKKYFFIKKSCFLHNFFFLFRVICNDIYVSKNKERVGKFIKSLFKFLHLKPKLFRKIQRNLAFKYSDKDCQEVIDLGGFKSDHGLPKSLFKSGKKVPFESLNIIVPENYDSFLKIEYGDYMKLPPKDERTNHFNEFIDFGNY